MRSVAGAVHDGGLGSRAVHEILAEIGKVESIIDAELAHFVEWERSSEVDPSIAALLAKAEELRSGEVERMLGRVKDLSERDRAAVDRAAAGATVCSRFVARAGASASAVALAGLGVSTFT